MTEAVICRPRTARRPGGTAVGRSLEETELAWLLYCDAHK